MKQVVVQVLVRGEEHKDVIMHLDVPENELEALTSAVIEQCEEYVTEDLGPGDEDEDYDDDDIDYGDDDDYDEDYEEEEDYY